MVFAAEPKFFEMKLNLVDSIARIEEGQKSIITEMRERFKSIDQRFELMQKEMNQRFEGMQREMNQRFEAIDKRFEAIDKRFEGLQREMNQRFKSMQREMNQRFLALEKRIDTLDNYFLALLAAIVALMGYIIWDRKTAFENIYKKIEALMKNHIEQYHDSPEAIPQMHQKNSSIGSVLPNDQSSSIDHPERQEQLIPPNIQEQLDQVIAFINQFPEMRQKLKVAS
jgi:predicted nuclease with TOPRIM domain